MLSSNPFRIPALLLVILCASEVYGQGYHNSYQPAQIDRYIGQQSPDIWDEDLPIERFLTSVAKRSKFRLDYLHWDLDSPRNTNMGSEISDIADPLVPFQVFDNLNGGASAGLGVVPGTNNLGMEDTSGIRGTLEVALNGGQLELSVFGTEQTGDSFVLTNLQTGRVVGSEALGTALRPNIVTPLTTNGAVSSSTTMNAFIYDDSFHAQIDSQLWGTEFLLLQDYYLPNNAFNWQWLGGFRYISFDEEFTQTGTYTNGGALATPVSTVIGGEALNNVYGPEVGGRASLRSKYVSLSATPRIAFALNDHRDSVTSGPLTAANEAPMRFTQESIDFSPILEINFQAQIHVSPNFSLIAGYDLMWIFKASRPNNNITYDSLPGTGGVFNPNITQKISLDDFYIQGFHFGGLCTY